MMRARRPMMALGLALCLALTGQRMAVARGATAATGQMVLCRGTGSAIVHTDKDGRPTSAPHVCPECALILLTAVLPLDALPTPDLATVRRAMPATTARRQAARRIADRTRAPPLSVAA